MQALVIKSSPAFVFGADYSYLLCIRNRAGEQTVNKDYIQGNFVQGNCHKMVKNSFVFEALRCFYWSAGVSFVHSYKYSYIPNLCADIRPHI